MKKTYSIFEIDELIKQAVENGIDLSSLGEINPAVLEKLVNEAKKKPNQKPNPFATRCKK